MSPQDGGARVALQVAYAASGEAWRTVAFAHVEEDGTYSVAHGFHTAGQASVRVLIHSKGQMALAASEPLAYEVVQAQNPKLTILASADPVTYGSPVTISGVAADAANQTITLLADSSAGSFTAVATTTSDAGGNYSFPQAPQQNTRYRVSDSATKSTVLFEGVKRALTLDPTTATAQAAQLLTLTGTLTPAAAGAPLYLERQNPSGIGFHIIATGTVNADAATYSIAHAFANVGTYVMRVKAPSAQGNEPSTSEQFTVVVSAAPAAALVPEAPARPVPSAG